MVFQPNETEKCVYIAIDDDNIALQPVEMIQLTLSIADEPGVTLGGTNETIVSIMDDDRKSLYYASNAL